MFGYLKPKSFIVNYCVLHAKHYIHKTRQMYQGTMLHYFSINTFLCRLKYAIQIEHTIAINNNNLVEFNEKFAKLYYVLEDINANKRFFTHPAQVCKAQFFFPH